MKKINFEKSLSDLEKIIETIEKGDLPLDKTLELYEKGVNLTKDCNVELKNAKLKIEELKPTKNN